MLLETQLRIYTNYTLYMLPQGYCSFTTAHVSCLFILEPHPPIDDVIRCEVIPRFIYFLQRDDNSMLQVWHPDLPVNFMLLSFCRCCEMFTHTLYLCSLTVECCIENKTNWPLCY